jgi:hypothetical protein
MMKRIAHYIALALPKQGECQTSLLSTMSPGRLRLIAPAY